MLEFYVITPNKEMQILLIQLTSTNNVGDAFQNDFNLKMQVLAYLIPQLQLTSLAERGMLLDALINRDGTIFHDATVMESSTSCSYQGIFRTDRWMEGWTAGRKIPGTGRRKVGRGSQARILGCYTGGQV